MKFIFATDLHLSSISPASRIDDYADAVFRKIEYLLIRCIKEKAILLLGGDLFSTPTQPDYIKNRLKTLILKSKIRVISIVGNHDLLYYNEDYIDRTSFQSLVSPGVIEYPCDYVNNSITIDGWSIVGHSFGKEFPRIENKKTIILSHAFYDLNKGDRLSVSREQVHSSGAAIVCFGHDHNQYAVENNNGTFVVRPGALTRGTSHTENRVRQVGFAIITIEGDAVKSIDYEIIPFALKFEEVFREHYEINHERTLVSFEDIQKFIDELKNAKMEVNAYDILLKLGKPDKINKRCAHYLEAVGLFN